MQNRRVHSTDASRTMAGWDSGVAGNLLRTSVPGPKLAVKIYSLIPGGGGGGLVSPATGDPLETLAVEDRSDAKGWWHKRGAQFDESPSPRTILNATMRPSAVAVAGDNLIENGVKRRGLPAN